ncbi:MAG TPA: AI-2E family transporter [Candidatus Sulfotelmatobacter sp.]|nr:AI-2E family transporter [Candidatus Sulfotelmatobacter sp.]
MSSTLVRRTVTVIVVAIVLVAATLFAARIPHTISIFVIAAFIAFGAHPLVKQLERFMPRPAGIAIVYAGLLGLMLLLALVIVPVGYGQILVLVQNAPQYIQAGQNLVVDAEHTIRNVFGNRVALPSYAQIETAVGDQVRSLMVETLTQFGAIVVGVVGALVVGTSALILSVFFLLQAREVRDGILAFVPPGRRLRAAALVHELAEVFGHYVAGQALLCTIVGVAVWVLLAPFHFQFALLVGLVCGIGYAIPFVGMLVAQILAALLAVPQGTGMVVWVTVAIFVVGRIGDNLLVPKIMAESLGVSPITVMFAVFAGGELFGVPGLLLGIPAAALLRVLFRYFVQPYVVRMQTQSLVTHVDTADGVHIDVRRDADAGDPSVPETVVVTVAPTTAGEG